MIKAFPKIMHLGTKYVQTIFDGPVEITEKVDGSQFAFGRIDGELVCRSKGKEMPIDAPEKMFTDAVEHVVNVESAIPDNTVFYCEYVRKPKHNSLTYERIPKNTLTLFGVADGPREFMQPDRRDIEIWAETLDIDVIPLLFSGETSAAEAMAMIDRESHYGGCNVEGVVVKAYKDCWIADRLYPVMAAKFVSEAFKEVHQNWSKEKTGKGKWQTFVEGYRTEARWQKAVQHLQERGLLAGEPRDIGALIKEVHADIREEEAGAIKDFLYKEFGSELLRRSTAGLPEWYKERIALGEVA